MSGRLEHPLETVDNILYTSKEEAEKVAASVKDGTIEEGSVSGSTGWWVVHPVKEPSYPFHAFYKTWGQD